MSERMDFTDFEDFWLHFVSSHTRESTRWAHVAALATGAGAIAIAAQRRSIRPLLIGVGISAALAMGSHPLLEGKATETFGHRAWAARAFLRLCFRTVDGTIYADLERSAERDADA